MIEAIQYSNIDDMIRNIKKLMAKDMCFNCSKVSFFWRNREYDMLIKFIQANLFDVSVFEKQKGFKYIGAKHFRGKFKNPQIIFGIGIEFPTNDKN